MRSICPYIPSHDEQDLATILLSFVHGHLYVKCSHCGKPIRVDQHYCLSCHERNHRPPAMLKFVKW